GRIVSVKRRLRLGERGVRAGEEDEDGKEQPCGRVHFAVARFFQNRIKLSSVPNSVLNTVESARRMSPARVPPGGIHRKALNSRLPASMNGCGFETSIGCRARTCTAAVGSVTA